MAGDIYELEGLAIPEELEHLHDLLERAAAEHADLDPMDALLFETAVIEIANNVVEHGRPHGKVIWHFVIEVGDDRLEATLSDSGEEFAADLTAVMPDEWSEGGRGVPLALATLDELTYDRTGGTNRWKMVRRRRAAPGQMIPSREM